MDKCWEGLYFSGDNYKIRTRNTETKKNNFGIGRIRNHSPCWRSHRCGKSCRIEWTSPAALLDTGQPCWIPDLDKLWAYTDRFASIFNVFKNETSFSFRFWQDEGKYCSFCFASEAFRGRKKDYRGREIVEAVRVLVEAVKVIVEGWEGLQRPWEWLKRPSECF